MAVFEPWQTARMTADYGRISSPSCGFVIYDFLWLSDAI